MVLAIKAQNSTSWALIDDFGYLFRYTGYAYKLLDFYYYIHPSGSTLGVTLFHVTVPLKK